MKKVNGILVIFILFLVSCGMSEEEERIYLQEKYIEARLMRYQDFKIQKCKDMATEIAIKQVRRDIKKIAKELSTENKEMKESPVKPKKPESILKEDTTQLKPLLRDSIRPIRNKESGQE